MESKKEKTQIKQHNSIEFIEERLIFDSNFDSGNLVSVQKVNEQSYNLIIAEDCEDLGIKTESFRVWFYFRVRNLQKDIQITFTIKSLSKLLKGTLLKGHCPVYHVDGTNDGAEYDRKWVKLNRNDNNVNFIEDANGLDLNFSFTLKELETVYFAYTYPWSYNDNLVFIKGLQLSLKKNKWIYFNCETIIKSLEQRKIHYLTLTSNKNQIPLKEKTIHKYLFKNNPDKRPFIFVDKKYIVISARVHPAETPASFALQGAIDFLIKNPIFLDNFVFVIIPMLNPDGVFRGYYRLDTNGKNLNRVYHTSYYHKYPSIFALKKIVNHLNNENRLFAYFDFHAHNEQEKCFLYGNKGEIPEDSIDIMLIPKIMSLITEKFDLSGCRFQSKGFMKNIPIKGDKTLDNENSENEKINEKEEKKKDINFKQEDGNNEINKEKNEEENKFEQVEVFGIAKTYFFKHEKLKLSYTFECSYNENSYVDETQNGNFGRNGFRELGGNLMLSIFEYSKPNEKSILETKGYKTINELKEELKKT